MLRLPLFRLHQTSRSFTHLAKTSKRFLQIMADQDRPSGLIANKGLELLTFGTPNGHKVSILLEELKEAYELDYVFQSISIMQNIQKEPWFTALGPNGRIPVLVDHDKGGLAIMEGAAILAYLSRHYDPEHKFSFAEDPDLSVQEQWIAWQHGGLGPMQGQANHFYRFAPERIPYPTQRYVGESERLFGVLDIRLKDRDYLAGPGRGKYSTADIANFSWVNWSIFAGMEISKWPNLERWQKAIEARPAVEKGVNVPTEPFGTNKMWKKKLESDEEQRKKDEGLKEELKKAQEQYKYKYSAP